MAVAVRPQKAKQNAMLRVAIAISPDGFWEAFYQAESVRSRHGATVADQTCTPIYSR
jgi:hypothetical protein